jgi:hypothetical protein
MNFYSVGEWKMVNEQLGFKKFLLANKQIF